MKGPGLTKAKLEALKWFAMNGPAHLFPLDGSAPSMVIRTKLENEGMIHRVGIAARNRVGIGFIQYDLSDLGRETLTEATKGNPDAGKARVR